MSQSAVAVNLSESNIELGSVGATARMAALGVGVGSLSGAFGLAFSGMIEWDLFWRSWLQCWIFVLQISLGAFFFVFVQHLTHAGWSVAVRRPAEALASNLNWLWIGFLPIAALLFMGDAYGLFPWSNMTELAAHAPAEAHLVEGKLAYLNVPFFLIRAAAYFVIWAGLATWFWKTSTRQDKEGGEGLTLSMGRVAAPAALLFGVTISFAAFDWIMSLSPAWFSTMFGVYFFSGCATAGFSALILTCVLLQRNGRLETVITNEHYQDMGKLLFAFGMVFWAYIGFSQYMLIWYANIPEETGWFLARQFGAWGWMSAALLFGHFCIPFLFLISKHPKRNFGLLSFAAVWMLFFAWFDMYWLVMPEIPHDLASFETYAAASEAYADQSTGLLRPVNWLLLAGMLGVFVFFTIGRLKSHALLCRRDPWLDESLRFENM